MPSVLIIDDDLMFCEMLCQYISSLGHDTASAKTLREGLEAASRGVCDIVFLDVNLPDGNGLEILPKLLNQTFPPEVIIITGEGDPDGAELAIRCGAWDYIEKPASLNMIALPLIRALQYREEKKARKSALALKREGIIGSSEKILKCLDLVARGAETDSSILVSGETGTGKELFAWAIHQNSSRKNGNFVVVDCASLLNTLVESIMFGYEKGAFTGAVDPRWPSHAGGWWHPLPG